VERFARLLDALAFQYQRTGKVLLLADHFAHVPDPDRGYALAALTGDLDFAHAKPALVRGLIAERVDPVLFALSYDYVGDLAETVALMWPARAGANREPTLADVIDGLDATGKAGTPALVAGWLDALDAVGRWALLKLLLGGLRVGVSARLAKTALAQWAGTDVAEIEDVWHAVRPPYTDLFAWLEGRGPRPEAGTGVPFRPVMLAQPLDEADLAALDPAHYRAEWKWDGIRVQAVAAGGLRRLYTRTGEDIGAAFPDVLEALDFDAAIDGELLVVRDGQVASFADLQKRLGRKAPGKALLRDNPAWIRAYDLLVEGGEDLRGQPFDVRRARLEMWHAARPRPRIDLSAMVPFDDWAALAEARRRSGMPGVEGMMLKRGDSPYVGGRPKGPWFKWKRDPHLVDAVLMYAQRGHGKRSSLYSDFTFGVWRAGDLVPVGKAYFGFTDAELAELDRWVRGHTTNRFGPVREVEKALVLEVAFERLQRSPRHRSGLAMRFPRISRIRWDKPAAEADTIEALLALLAADEAAPA
jgi:DNA ligase-1